MSSFSQVQASFDVVRDAAWDCLLRFQRANPKGGSRKRVREIVTAVGGCYPLESVDTTKYPALLIALNAAQPEPEKS